jgi:predicted acetyltransferase
VNIEIGPAKISDRLTITNLYQLYLYDLSEMFSTTIKSNGLFSHPDISAYWSDANRFAFLFIYNDSPAGFALVGRGSVWSEDPEVFDMADFFVRRDLRRHGIGRAGAEALFVRFAGSWDVRVLVNDPAALAFWSVVIHSSTIGPIERTEWTDPDGLRHLVHRFTTLPAGSA